MIECLLIKGWLNLSLPPGCVWINSHAVAPFALSTLLDGNHIPDLILYTPRDPNMSAPPDTGNQAPKPVRLCSLAARISPLLTIVIFSMYRLNPSPTRRLRPRVLLPRRHSHQPTVTPNPKDPNPNADRADATLRTQTRAGAKRPPKRMTKLKMMANLSLRVVLYDALLVPRLSQNQSLKRMVPSHLNLPDRLKLSRLKPSHPKLSLKLGSLRGSSLKLGLLAPSLPKSSPLRSSLLKPKSSHLSPNRPR